jgi:pimeloyl-ACP methyl ester carboxylesterase
VRALQSGPRGPAEERVKTETVPGDVALHLEVDGPDPATPPDPAAAPPTLCLLHGFGGSARNWRPQARALRERARVAAFDVRGHARSVGLHRRASTPPRRGPTRAAPSA